VRTVVAVNQPKESLMFVRTAVVAVVSGAVALFGNWALEYRAAAAGTDVVPAGVAELALPYCATEDGSDYPGRYCLWVDPDTGRGYVNGFGGAYATLGGAR
jgi:hypothetical protein